MKFLNKSLIIEWVGKILKRRKVIFVISGVALVTLISSITAGAVVATRTNNAKVQSLPPIPNIATFKTRAEMQQLQNYQEIYDYDKYSKTLKENRSVAQLEWDLAVIYQLYFQAAKPFLVLYKNEQQKYSLYPKYAWRGPYKNEWKELIKQKRMTFLTTPEQREKGQDTKYDHFFVYLVKWDEAIQTNKFFLSILANLQAQWKQLGFVVDRNNFETWLQNASLESLKIIDDMYRFIQIGDDETIPNFLSPVYEKLEEGNSYQLDSLYIEYWREYGPQYKYNLKQDPKKDDYFMIAQLEKLKIDEAMLNKFYQQRQYIVGFPRNLLTRVNQKLKEFKTPIPPDVLERISKKTAKLKELHKLLMQPYLPKE